MSVGVVQDVEIVMENGHRFVVDVVGLNKIRADYSRQGVLFSCFQFFLELA